MSLGPLVLVNLVVVAAFVGLVAEEVNGLVLDAGDVLLRRQVFEAVGLVPAGGEDVEGNLPTDGVAVKRGNKRGGVDECDVLAKGKAVA